MSEPLVHDKYSRGRRLLAQMCIVMIVTSCAQLYLSMLITEKTYYLDELKDIHYELKTEVAILEQEVDSLNSPYNLAEEAEKLGMIQGTDYVFLDLKSKVAVPIG